MGQCPPRTLPRPPPMSMKPPPKKNPRLWRPTRTGADTSVGQAFFHGNSLSLRCNVAWIFQAGQYVLCWDPLDGSSIVDNNWAVGTIIGVWDKSTGLIGATGRDQVMSIVTLYGPRTTVFITLDDGVYEFTLGDGTLELSWLWNYFGRQFGVKHWFFGLRKQVDLLSWQDLHQDWVQDLCSCQHASGPGGGTGEMKGSSASAFGWKQLTGFSFLMIPKLTIEMGRLTMVSQEPVEIILGERVGNRTSHLFFCFLFQSCSRLKATTTSSITTWPTSSPCATLVVWFPMCASSLRRVRVSSPTPHPRQATSKTNRARHFKLQNQSKRFRSCFYSLIM